MEQPHELMDAALMAHRAFSSADGRQFLDYLKDYCGFENEVFVAGSADTTAYACGMRSVYLHIHQLLEMKKQAESAETEPKDENDGSDPE